MTHFSRSNHFTTSPRMFVDPSHPFPTIPPKKASLLHQSLLELVLIITMAVLFGFAITHFMAQAKVINGHSMAPTLQPGQRIIVDKISYQFQTPQRGDIVIIQGNDGTPPLIKRIIGLPGETVAVLNGRVTINEISIYEGYLPANVQQSFEKITIPEGYIYVMGDNRVDSRDSRDFGPIPIAQLDGRAWVSVWPLDTVGPIQ